MMYSKGEGTAQDDKKAVEWYEQAAAQGDAGSYKELGLMYLEGKGVAQDVKKAVEQFDQAARKGNAEAQGMLGRMYLEGKGVDKDYAQAYIWNAVAVANGNFDALTGLDITRENLTPTALKEADSKARKYFEQYRYQPKM